jgi:L-asparaginase
MGALRRVKIFSMGGTIASTSDARDQEANGGVRPALGAGELARSVQGLGSVATIEAVSFMQVPSGDLTPGDIVRLSHEIEAAYRDGSDGVVVTQGTDTLEETAFMLDLLVGDQRPIVVTGAMRNPTLAGADGPANILAAVQVAASSEARSLGVLVVMNDEIHAARFATKTHTSGTDTFRSAGFGPLGRVNEGRPRIVFTPPPLARPVRHGEGLASVALVKLGLGDDCRLVEVAERDGADAVVVEGFGGGHLPGPAVDRVAAVAQRIPVVLASRTGSGEMLSRTYGFAGSEMDLARRGLLSAGMLSGTKARIALMLLAGEQGSDRIERVSGELVRLCESFYVEAA